MKLLKEYGLEDSKISLFEKYRNLLLEWNEKFNLTAIKDLDEIEEKHFVDSLYLDKFVNLENKTLLDVGSGAGFPGIPLAIAHPNLKVFLLESNGKKVSFLKEVVKQLDLKNVEVIQSRAEEFLDKERFDIVTARAVKELNILLEICIPLVKIGGTFAAYKSNAVDEEISHAKHAYKVLDITKVERFDYQLPNSKDNRVLLLIFKTKPTKKKYPRNYSEIVKAPL